MTLNNLLVEMRAEFEKLWILPNDFTPTLHEPIYDLDKRKLEVLSFIASQMKRVSEETYKATHQQIRYMRDMDSTIWNRFIDACDEAYKTFTHQP